MVKKERKNFWNNKPLWLRGGIIGALVYFLIGLIVVFMVLFSIDLYKAAIFPILMYLPGVFFLNSDLLIIFTNWIIYFFIGAVIGWAISRIKRVVRKK